VSILIPVIYKNMNYPSRIKANIHEVSGNFYKEKLIVNTPYSLHTEPSAVPKTFCSKIDKDLTHIKEAQKNRIPQLWHSEEWAKEFFIFIDHLISSNKTPKLMEIQPPKLPEVLEIHPPFNDYCPSFDQFLYMYKVFYRLLKENYPDQFIGRYPATTILIENRFGTRYKGGNFLLSTCSDILELCKVLNNENIDLKIALDYPQLFSAEVIPNKKKNDNWMGSNPSQLLEKIISFNQKLEKYKELIGGFHMWGKLKKGDRWIPHAGSFDTFFSGNDDLKNEFLKSVFSTFNDGIMRYFVPELNSGESDLHSIVTDMEQAGFTFTSAKIKK